METMIFSPPPLVVNLVSEHLLLLFSILIFAAVLVTKVGSRYGVPSLLLFLLLGMVAGEDVLGVHFDDFELAENIGHFAMTIILFTAGLETSFKETRPIVRQGTLLSTAGVLLTILFSGVFIWLVSDAAIPVSMSLTGCFLLAAVMGSTDSASVFSVLRSKKLHLRENLGSMLELESGSNDPMAYILTIVLTQLMTESPGSMGVGKLVMTGFGLVFLQVFIGAAIGFGVGYAGRWILGRLQLASSPLYAILILSLGYFANGIAGLLMGNGLLALYVTALMIGNRTYVPHRKEILHFFDGMTWLMQLVMFLMLGLLARPSKMLPMLVPALVIGLFMIFVSRPASVFLCLLPHRLPDHPDLAPAAGDDPEPGRPPAPSQLQRGSPGGDVRHGDPGGDGHAPRPYRDGRGPEERPDAPRPRTPPRNPRDDGTPGRFLPGPPRQHAPGSRRQARHHHGRFGRLTPTRNTRKNPAVPQYGGVVAFKID